MSFVQSCSLTEESLLAVINGEIKDFDIVFIGIFLPGQEGS